jgi:hypothetical protein
METDINKPQMSMSAETEKQQNKKEAKASKQAKKQKKSKQKTKLDDSNSTGLFGTVAEPRKSLSTYLRNQNKAEISIISILDRKAAILIRISVSLITGLIVFNNYVADNVEYGSLLSQILLGGMMISLTLAILSTKPSGRLIRRFFKSSVKLNHPKTEENIFFLTHNYSLEEYEAAMQKVVHSQDLQIGNQVRANYVIATNNGIKAKILDIAYSFFLLSILVVGIFFVTCGCFLPS